MNFTQTHDIETSIIRKLDNPFTFSSPRPLITKLGRRIRITVRTCITVFSQKRVKKRCHPSAESSKSATTLFSKVKTRDLIPCSLPFFFQFRLLTPFRPTHSQGLSFGKARGVRLPWRRDPHNDTSVQPLLHARETSSMHS